MGRKSAGERDHGVAVAEHTIDLHVQYSRSITSREVFWDFGMKGLVWEWFGLFL